MDKEEQWADWCMSYKLWCMMYAVCCMAVAVGPMHNAWVPCTMHHPHRTMQNARSMSNCTMQISHSHTPHATCHTHTTHTLPVPGTRYSSVQYITLIIIGHQSSVINHQSWFNESWNMSPMTCPSGLSRQVRPCGLSVFCWFYMDSGHANCLMLTSNKQLLQYATLEARVP